MPQQEGKTGYKFEGSRAAMLPVADMGSAAIRLPA